MVPSQSGSDESHLPSVDDHFLIISVGDEEGKRTPGGPFKGVSNPFMRIPQSLTNHLLKAPRLNTIKLGIRILTYEFFFRARGTHTHIQSVTLRHHNSFN